MTLFYSPKKSHYSKIVENHYFGIKFLANIRNNFLKKDLNTEKI